MQIRPDRKISMAMKWLILYSRRKKSLWLQRLASECLAAAKEEGLLLRKNGYSQDGRAKAFSHFRF
jgi:small subunit ribosomal protein S7